MASRPGRPSASTRTSSRRRGRRCSTRSTSGCSERRPEPRIRGPRLTSRAMPTDPFVPSDPADRPRQQQNLPPGLAPPPASDWRADRPGDLTGAQPEGALLGRPGPNIGYAYTLAARARDGLRLAPSEYAGDALAVISEIAAKRAAAFGRAPVMGDIDVA